MEKMLSLKLAITAAFSALCTFLGWKGILAVAWVIAMALDYLSGTIAACKTGEWSSATARSGLAHKGGMILVVAASCIADIVLYAVCTEVNIGFEWPVLIFPVVIAWYVVTELGSILENSVKLGAAVPEWLTKLLKIGLKAIDAAGEKVVPKDE